MDDVNVIVIVIVIVIRMFLNIFFILEIFSKSRFLRMFFKVSLRTFLIIWIQTRGENVVWLLIQQTDRYKKNYLKRNIDNNGV